MLAVCESIVLKALGYKPEGRGFETRLVDILILPNSGFYVVNVGNKNVNNE
jgi:hypothetical protein